MVRERVSIGEWMGGLVSGWVVEWVARWVHHPFALSFVEESGMFGRAEVEARRLPVPELRSVGPW